MGVQRFQPPYSMVKKHVKAMVCWICSLGKPHMAHIIQIAMDKLIRQESGGQRVRFGRQRSVADGPSDVMAQLGVLKHGRLGT